MVRCALARDHRPWNLTRSADAKILRLLAGFSLGVKENAGARLCATAGKDFHLTLKINY
jgi:hypothetical protein